MVRAGLLSQYVKKSEQSATGSIEQVATNMILSRGAPLVIHVIQGGPIDQHWESKCRHRAMIQESSDVEKIGTEHYSFVLGTMEPVNGAITFNTRDLAWITVPHEDALVLSLKIVGFQVCQVLVDRGSSINSFHISAYKQMGVPISTLGNPSWVITGFNRSTTWTLGEIILLVEVVLQP